MEHRVGVMDPSADQTMAVLVDFFGPEVIDDPALRAELRNRAAAAKAYPNFSPQDLTAARTSDQEALDAAAWAAVSKDAVEITPPAQIQQRATQDTGRAPLGNTVDFPAPPVDTLSTDRQVAYNGQVSSPFAPPMSGMVEIQTGPLPQVRNATSPEAVGN